MRRDSLLWYALMSDRGVRVFKRAMCLLTCGMGGLKSVSVVPRPNLCLSYVLNVLVRCMSLLWNSVILCGL